MKKIFLGALLGIALLSTSAAAVDVTVDGVNVVFTDAQTVVKDGRTLVPLRAVAEAMDADVQWNEREKSVVFTKEASDVVYDGKTYDKVAFVSEMKIGSFGIRIKMLYNGNEVYSVKKEMDIRAQNIDGRVYVPARYVGYALGYETDWKDNTVCYQNIKTQNTWFTVDKSVKFPTVVSDKFSTRAYKGYGSVVVADGDYGTRKLVGTGVSYRNVYSYTDGAWDYSYGGNIVIDTDNFKVDLSEPEATAENIKSVYLDIAGTTSLVRTEDSDTMRSLWLSGDVGRYYCASLAYRYVPIDAESDEYQPMWGITANSMPVDCRGYVYQDESGESVQGYKSGSKVITPYVTYYDDNADKKCSTDALLLLHTLLEETGERIWQMMYDYYGCCGYQALTQTEYVSADFVTPPISEAVTALYGLSFKGYSKIDNGYYVLDLNDEVNGNNIRITYTGVRVKDYMSPTRLLSGYSFSVAF